MTSDHWFIALLFLAIFGVGVGTFMEDDPWGRKESKQKSCCCCCITEHVEG